MQNENQNPTKEKTQLSLKMERTGCYGQCPIYDLTVDSDGKIVFEGKFYTKAIGKAEDKLSEEKLKQLIAAIDEHKFFSFDNDYGINSQNCPSAATDMASVTLFVQIDGKSKTIKHYLGCSEIEPPTPNNSKTDSPNVGV